MTEISFELHWPNGLHARPAGQLAKSLSQFACKVELMVGDRRVNAKSTMMIMSLALKPGAMLTFQLDGPDEAIAHQALSSFFASEPVA